MYLPIEVKIFEPKLATLLVLFFHLRTEINHRRDKFPLSDLIDFGVMAQCKPPESNRQECKERSKNYHKSWELSLIQ